MDNRILTIEWSNCYKVYYRVKVTLNDRCEGSEFCSTAHEVSDSVYHGIGLAVNNGECCNVVDNTGYFEDLANLFVETIEL